jgi:hypothetical protein
MLPVEEEMLRLRTYEKLQSLVGQGAVTRTVKGVTKNYKGSLGETRHAQRGDESHTRNGLETSAQGCGSGEGGCRRRQLNCYSTFR